MTPIEEAKPYLNELELVGYHVKRRADIPVANRKNHVAYVRKKKDDRFRVFLSYHDNCWHVGIPKQLPEQEEPDPPKPGSSPEEWMEWSLARQNRPAMIWLEYGSVEAAINRINRWLRDEQ